MTTDPTTHPTPVRIRGGYIEATRLHADSGDIWLFAGCEPVITDTGAERRPLVEIHAPDAEPLVLPADDTGVLAFALGQSVRAARTSVTAIRPDGRESSS